MRDFIASSPLGDCTTHAGLLASLTWVDPDECPRRKSYCWCDHYIPCDAQGYLDASRVPPTFKIELLDEGTINRVWCPESVTGQRCPSREAVLAITGHRWTGPVLVCDCADHPHTHPKSRAPSNDLRHIAGIQAHLKAGLTLNQAESEYSKAGFTRWTIVVASSWLEEHLFRTSPEYLKDDPVTRALVRGRDTILRMYSRRNALPKKVGSVVNDTVRENAELEKAIEQKTKELQSEFPHLGLTRTNAIRSLILKGSRENRVVDPASRKRSKR